MALENSEIQSIIKVLRETLISLELTWIVEQVNETISQGKTVSRTFKDLEVDEELFYLEKQQSFPRNKKEIVVSEEYTDLEQLEIIIEGIERAVIDSFYIEKELIKSMKAELLEAAEFGVRDDFKIQFSSELDDSEEFNISSSDLDKRENSITKLYILLIELKKEFP